MALAQPKNESASPRQAPFTNLCTHRNRKRKRIESTCLTLTSERGFCSIRVRSTPSEGRGTYRCHRRRRVSALA